LAWIRLVAVRIPESMIAQEVIPSLNPRRRVLVVEDERIVALDLRCALEDLGYAVVGTAASSDEALRAVDERRPDLVLMDIRISGARDGIQTAGMLRTQHRLPVVYLTANADAETLARALATEPAGYLVKPYNPHSLRTTIEVAFCRHEAEIAQRREHEREKEQLQRRSRKATERMRRLQREATIDPLTGLHNRRHLDSVLKREISFAQRGGHSIGILLVDLDRFKQLNDTFGHAAGDAALRAVGTFLRTRLRAYDIACRLGGDEIVVVVPGADATAALALAEQLRTGIEQLVIAGVGGATLTASLGVAVFPDHGITSDGLLQAADAALYQAKAEGRDRVARARAAS
jgi:diguanylate cyclase (GGDEF)-like protein